MKTKIVINGKIEVVTGLHIGTGGEFAAIGAVDSPVVKDQITQQPIIPGSSLKGKLRTLLAQDKLVAPKEPSKDPIEIKRMFGDSNSSDGKTLKSRFIFSDCFLANKDELDSYDVNTTEVKFENGINRINSVATPRQIERVIRGAKFNMNIVYDVEKRDEACEDFKNLKRAMNLLEFDYLGGGGSRGNGRVKFIDLTAEVVIGEDDELGEECQKILQGE